MSFKDVRFMTPLPPDELSKGANLTDYEDWLENYRLVRQRTVRSETTALLKISQKLFLRQMQTTTTTTTRFICTVTLTK